jgi:pimeloyl-ACP methyl ester carboxylesterase
MNTVTSKDGTTIAFDKVGSGPALILVAGAIQHRAFDQETAKLAELLSPHFTVINYDRRGRGDSADTLPYALEREIEDVEALIDFVGGSASLYGVSSGAALAMEVALALPAKVRKLAMYEAPLNDDAAARQAWKDYRKQLQTLLSEGRRGDAMILFMTLVGMPAEHASEARQWPVWPILEGVAHTLAYDATVLGEEAAVPTDRAARLKVPALVMEGDASYPWMRTTAIALAEAMPYGQHRTLEGQTHEVSADALAPVLAQFFQS